MTLNDFITLQEQYTKHELCQNMEETLVATTKERLYRHSHECNWTISYLEHTDKNKVFLITKKNKTFPEIWVSSTYTRYRAAFKKYLKEFFAIDNIPFNFHVDHMQSKVFFKNKYPEYFIRLFLLDKKINCYYGCKYEKLQASYEKNREPNDGYHMSFIQMAKMYGFSLPDLHTSLEQMEQWALKFAEYLELLGYEQKEWNYPGIISTLNATYKNLNINHVYHTPYGRFEMHQNFLD